MTRRLHVSELRPGVVRLDDRQSHHARDVLRLPLESQVEVFDDVGNVGSGIIIGLDMTVEVRVDQVRAAGEGMLRWTIASAVPKGNRADWMVEKLSELGTWRFVPLETARAVVLPEGEGKRGRWERLAEESAKQSRRSGVMRIELLTKLRDLLKQESGPGWFLSTSAGVVAMPAAVATVDAAAEHLLLLIGPEGGWTEEEEEMMRQKGLTPVSLGVTILRVETAAVAAAAIVGAMIGRTAPGAAGRG